MDEKKDVFEIIKEFIDQYPALYGVLFLGIGVAGLVMTIRNSEWLFGHSLSYNPKKIDGMVNLYGRGVTRVIVGVNSVLVILGGLFWILYYTCLT